jgi:hypothetical protein
MDMDDLSLLLEAKVVSAAAAAASSLSRYCSLVEE